MGHEHMVRGDIIAFKEHAFGMFAGFVGRFAQPFVDHRPLDRHIGRRFRCVKRFIGGP